MSDRPHTELRTAVLGTLMPGFVGPTLPDWLGGLLDEGLGGVCLFGQNVVDREQVRALTDDIRTHRAETVISIDEEGGDVTRLHYATGSPYPGNALLGRIDDLALTEATGRWVGEELRAVGCTMTLAPDADINSDPRNPVIGTRSFGTDPEHVARHVVAWVRGVQSAGIASSVKHFPGHGDTAADSHLALPVVDRSLVDLRTRELVPFAAACEAGAATVMTSHILLPQLDAERPATMSAPILRLLRSEFSYEGVIVSDALDMVGASGEIGIPAAAVRALAAGVDLCCIGTENTSDQMEEIVAAVIAAVRAGDLSRTRVEQAAARVRALGSIGSTSSSGAPSYPLPTVAAAFDIRTTVPEGFSVLRLDSEANIAVGEVPWGPFAAGLSADAVATDSLTAVDLPEGPVVVIGRDIHRRAWATDLIDRLRAGRTVVTVEMGWPADDRAYADIATFGASRLVGEALLEVLNRGQ